MTTKSLVPFRSFPCSLVGVKTQSKASSSSSRTNNSFIKARSIKKYKIKHLQIGIVYYAYSTALQCTITAVHNKQYVEKLMQKRCGEHGESSAIGMYSLRFNNQDGHCRGCVGCRRQSERFLVRALAHSSLAVIQFTIHTYCIRNGIESIFSVVNQCTRQQTLYCGRVGGCQGRRQWPNCLMGSLIEVWAGASYHQHHPPPMLRDADQL